MPPHGPGLNALVGVQNPHSNTTFPSSLGALTKPPALDVRKVGEGIFPANFASLPTHCVLCIIVDLNVFGITVLLNTYM